VTIPWSVAISYEVDLSTYLRPIDSLSNQ